MAETIKIRVVAATLMVAGNIMGSGLSMLPANLAATAGIAISGWLVTLLGAIALAMTHSRLTEVMENSAGVRSRQGASRAHAREGCLHVLQ